MSTRGPSFDDLVGGDLDPAERERLFAVHEMLIEAGPPPELAVPGSVVELRPRRRRGVLLALAAALAVALFAFGAATSNRSEGPSVVAMSGTSAAPGASGSLTVFAADAAGNWPMQVTVRGLAPTPSGRPYELWLTKSGRPGALCGSFRTDPDGTATVPLNAPYKLKDFDGWVVVEEGTRTPLLSTA